MTATPRIEDFYEKPAATEVLLTGGAHDGRRMLVPDNRDTWVMPPPEPVHDLAYYSEIAARARRGEPPETVMDKTILYQWTGSILDDGTRVFAAS